MRTVRTTFHPDHPYDVDDAEYLDLQRQGLLVADEDQGASGPAADVDEQPATARRRTPKES